jgi:hypothetical protein
MMSPEDFAAGATWRRKRTRAVNFSFFALTLDATLRRPLRVRGTEVMGRLRRISLVKHLAARCTRMMAAAATRMHDRLARMGDKFSDGGKFFAHQVSARLPSLL